MDKLVINRQKIKEEFARYTSNYDISDDKIRLKVEHTYRVADLCDKIATGIKLSADDTDLAWLIGILHDVGRFEQVRRYGTFSDADSIDHAHFAVNILFDNGEITRFLDNYQINKLGDKLEIVKKAIWNHSAYRVEKGLNRRTQMFCDLIRDADKVDIFKVINDIPLENIYDVAKNSAYDAEISDSVMQSLREHHAVLRSLKKTPVDHIAGHIALAFELVFPISICIAKEQGYLENLMKFESHNEKTVGQFKEIQEIITAYMQNKITQADL